MSHMHILNNMSDTEDVQVKHKTYSPSNKAGPSSLTGLLIEGDKALGRGLDRY